MAQVSVRPAPGNLDIDIADSTLALRTARIQRALKNAAWELWRNRLATVGAVMVLILFLLAILAPFIATHDPVKQNYREMLQGPSAAHYFGTDKFGRDIFSRVVWATQRMMTIAVLAVVLGILGGCPGGRDLGLLRRLVGYHHDAGGRCLVRVPGDLAFSARCHPHPSL